MRRRTMLKGAALAAGTAILGIEKAVAASSDRVTLLGEFLLNGPYDSLPDRLRKGVGLLEAEWPDFEVRGWIAFDIYDEEGEPWLRHEVWNESPASLQVEGSRFFREKDWDLVQHAVRLRIDGWWRQEHKFNLSKDWAAWYFGQFNFPDCSLRVRVRFVGSVTPRPQDVETIRSAGSDNILHVRIDPL